MPSLDYFPTTGNHILGEFSGVEWRIIDSVLLPMPARWEGDDS